MRFSNLFNFGEDHSCFVFERRHHEFVIAFGVFSGTVFEFKIAKIIINRIATFEELVELGAMGSEIGSVRLNAKDEKKDGGSEGETGAEGGPVGEDGEKQDLRKCMHSVSPQSRERLARGL